jgi:hypothetical protein
MKTQLFGDYMREKYGPKWVLTQRLTPRMREKGYEVAVTPAQHDRDHEEWSKRCAANNPDIAALARLLVKFRDDRAAYTAAQIYADWWYEIEVRAAMKG